MTERSLLTALQTQFDPDAYDSPAVAVRLDVDQNDVEQPAHRHRKGQLVLALRGGVTCEVSNALWMVPPQHGVWIPGGLPHSNDATANAQIYFLFIARDTARMPAKCCILSINPLIRELIRTLAEHGPAYPRKGPMARLAAVLLEQLVAAPVQQLNLPVSEHPTIRRIAQALIVNCADRTTLVQWADRLGMSDRSLARLMVRETGLTFGRWRQQLHLIVALRELSAGASVQRVAGDLGYDSVTAFITMFKKALGKPPAQYFAELR